MRLISDLDFNRLLGAVNLAAPFGRRDHALLRLAALTGLRVGELVGLDVGLVWSCSCAPREWLDLPAAIAKGGRSRRVPLSLAARRAVTELVDFLRLRGFSVAPDAPLLCDRRHRRLPAREVQRMVQRLRELADLDVRVTPHSFRHHFATSRVQKAPVHTVQQILGHRRLESTAVYLHASLDDLRAVVEA